MATAAFWENQPTTDEVSNDRCRPGSRSLELCIEFVKGEGFAIHSHMGL